MNYNKKTVRDFDPHGKKVLLRCDFNVPQNKETGEITSDKRIVAALPTIKYLLENGAAVIACSHLGKPKGEWKESLSLAPVAKRLSELLGMDVIFAKDIIGEDAKAKAAALQPGQLLLLENLRFDKREEKNDPEFAKELASMADVYVSDAFGTVHRAHASTAGVAAFLPAYAGLLVEKEISVMGKALSDPARPFVAILGGAKVSDKIGVINNLLEKADTIIVGGGMAYTFKKAQGHTIGKSLLEADRVDYAKEMMDKAAAKGVKLLLPVDHVCAKEFAADAEPVVTGEDIPDDLMGMDIGPQDRRDVQGRRQGRRHRRLERPHGRFRVRQLQQGHLRHGRGRCQLRRRDHHRRRRQCLRGREERLCRQDHPHQHRRRRFSRVPRGPGAARRRLPA